MTEHQYRRANTAVFIVYMIIEGYVFLTQLVLFIAGETSWRSWIQTIVEILAIVVSVAAFIVWRGEKRCALALIGSAAMVYFVVSVVGVTRENAFIYCFPILLGAFAYLNLRMIIAGNAVIVVSNIVRIATSGKLFSEGVATTYVIQFLTVILTVVASIVLIQLLINFNKENSDAITAGMERQEESSRKMLLTADSIMKHFDEAMDHLNSLNRSVSSSQDSMREIAQSVEVNAESIQEQATMCVSIQEDTERVGEETRVMIEAARRTNSSVSEGTQAVVELKNQSGIVEEASRVTVEVVENLSRKVKDVENFTGVILSISSQTNLLALNASIEAARAGDAGKGFAVVAEEIRELSEQTQNASNSITEIIHELEADTKRVNDSILNSVDAVSKQHEMIELVQGRFDAVDREVEELTRNIELTEASVNNILASTATISENITQLSATSQQVAASSTESMTNAEQTTTDSYKCKEIFEAIYGLAQDLSRS